MVYIAYFTELNLQICDYAQKRHICRENCKYALDKNFHGHFCPRRKAAKFCHPGSDVTTLDRPILGRGALLVDSNMLVILGRGLNLSVFSD